MKRVFLIGPILFAGMTVVLTLIQYDFLRNLGWHPLEASTLDWPSGLALGPHGIWMTVTFLVSGLLLSFFALCLGADLKPDPALPCWPVPAWPSPGWLLRPIRRSVPRRPPGTDGCTTCLSSCSA
jgi:hypothetical protein